MSADRTSPISRFQSQSFINREDATALRSDACAVISRLFPDAVELYEQRGWSLLKSISRVYDSSQAEENSALCARPISPLYSKR